MEWYWWVLTAATGIVTWMAIGAVVFALWFPLRRYEQDPEPLFIALSTLVWPVFGLAVMTEKIYVCVARRIRGSVA